MNLEGATAVTPEQVAAWLRISNRKMTARRVLKSANPAMKFDHRVSFASLLAKSARMWLEIFSRNVSGFGSHI